MCNSKSVLPRHYCSFWCYFLKGTKIFDWATKRILEMAPMFEFGRFSDIREVFRLNQVASFDGKIVVVLYLSFACLSEVQA